MKAVLVLVVIYTAVAILGGWGGILVSQAKDLGPTYDRQPHITTSYYPEHHVFCATRLNAVNCVHIPEYIKEK